MSHSRIPSPARSLGAPVTPRRYKPRRTRSVGSPARSTTSGRLSAIIQFKENNKDSFALSPAPSRRSVLNDDTYIEEPRRRSWWTKLGDNSRDIMAVLNDNKILESNEAVEEYIDIEVLSQEKKNYTMDIPDSSDSESINSIVIPQRKLFTQKDLQTQNKYQKLIGTRETLAKLHKSNISDKSVNVAPKNLFSHNNRPRNKPVFPAALLNVSPNKTANKTKEMAAEVKGQVRNLFGNRGGTKRKNMFADFIVSESEDEISDIQPKVFGFQKKVEQRRDSQGKREHSPTSSITTDIEMDEWQHLPSSTMVDNQLEDMLAAGTPVKRAKLSKLAEIKESQIRAEGENEKESEEEQELKYDDDDVQSDNNSEKRHKHIVQNDNPDEIEQTENDQMQHENNHFINNKSHKDNIEIITEKLAQKEKKNKCNVHDISKGKNRTLNQSKGLNTSSNKTRNLSHNKTAVDEVDNQNKTQKTQNNSKRKTYIMSQSEIHNTSKIESMAEIQDTQPDTIQNKAESDEKSKVHIIKKSITDSNEKQPMEKAKNDVDDFVVDKNMSAKERDIMEEKEQGNSNNQMDSKNATKSINCEQATDKQEESQHENSVEQSQVQSDVDMQEESDKEEEQEGSEQIEQEESDQEEENDNDDEEQSEVEEENQDTHIDSEAEIQHENEMEVPNENQDEEQSKLGSEHEPENDEGMDVNDENKEDKYVRNEQEEIEDNEEQANIEEQIYDEGHNNIEEEDDRQDDNDEAHIESEGEVENVSEVEAQNKSEIEDYHESDVESQNESEMEVQENSQLDENEEEPDESNIEAEGSEPEQLEENDENQEDDEVERDTSNVEAEVSEQEDEEIHEESKVEDQDSEEEAQNESEELQYDQSEEEPSETEDAQNESRGDAQNESENEIQDSNDNDEVQLFEAEVPNVSHDTTGRNRKKNETKLNSPEAILHDKSNQIDSFMAQGRNTSIRKTTMLKNLNIRPSLAPPRESTGMSDGTRNSSVEGSGWDSHRTTRKTLRQTFGKDFTPRKSLRALVMEKSAKRQTAVNDLTSVTTKFPQANSTELPESSMVPEYEEIEEVSNHEVSKRTRQTTLEMYLQRIKNQNLEKKMKMEEAVRNSLKAPVRDSLNLFKVPSKPMFALKKSSIKPVQSKPKKQVKSMIPLDDLPQEVIEDMKYKPPKRFQPSNASWITKRLYKFLEGKLESKYDYKARVRAEKLVETIYHFAKDLRRHDVAPSNAVDMLKQEMARLDVVKTHFEFYQFFNEYMPREIRVKVVPDVVNKISMPRHGVFSDILRGNTVQG